jgi:D-aminoacyl-tRNA deacylase
MRAVIQRVSEASVKCSSGHYAEITQGLLIFIGIEASDGIEDIEWLSGKISRLRIFDDSDGIMNLSVTDNLGEALVISQFTLHSSTKKGNRPSYIKAAEPSVSGPLFERFLVQFEKDLGKKVEKGVFGDHMDVRLINDGPVTIFIDTKNKE